MQQAVLLNPLVRKAALCAEKHYHGQVRTHTGESFFTHCQAVALIVSLVTDAPEIVAAAYLHDILEDTDCSLDYIHQEFGLRVATLVGALTKSRYPAHIPANEQDRLVLLQLRAASSDAATIKLADITHNLRTRPACGDMDYMLEKAGQVAVLQHGQPLLVQLANQTVVHALSDALACAA
jgi:(p)ppGpp synthase/HD superfamily hydrolase